MSFALSLSIFDLAHAQSAAPQLRPSQSAASVSAPQIEEVVVTAERIQLLGTAETSSQGEVVQDELALTPAYRPAQLLETIPGLVVTSHSGEGKANQYLLRGFNLDHGTDLATFVDGMPGNMPTHAHGQGYTDLNFLVPELVGNIQFTKGPYFADEGDFSSVGSDHIGILDDIANQLSLTVGTLGFERLFTAGSRLTGSGTVLGALELQHYDGPWTYSDNQRKINAVVHFSGGNASQGLSVTAMYYRGLWNATTDQPERAVEQHLISRFSTLNPTDGGQAQRISLSSQYHSNVGAGHLEASAYIINNRLTLWNDFTHFLFDPINGDQEGQNENRVVVGGSASYTISGKAFGVDNNFLVGIQTRHDENHVSRDATKERQYVSTTEDDRVQETSLGGYAQATTFWAPWMRTVLGIRDDYISAKDQGTNGGNASASLLQFKGSLIVPLGTNAEFYVSAGTGFHSDDVRGVTQAQQQSLPGAPLIASSNGKEVGLRTSIMPNLIATLTAFEIDFHSETKYDADVGQDSAGPSSRRSGIELNTTYAPYKWLEIYTSVAASHARYREEYDDGTGHVGEHIPNAPSLVASLAGYVKNLGPWSGGLEYRYLGGSSLTPDNAVKGKGYGEMNVEGNYALETGWKVGVGLYNVLNTQANAAEFWYVDRLPSEPARGGADLHAHPLEGRAVRLTLSNAFE